MVGVSSGTAWTWPYRGLCCPEPEDPKPQKTILECIGKQKERALWKTEKLTGVS